MPDHEVVTPPAQREIMLQQMSKLTDTFYERACMIGCHPFIEFCGFMNEWIKMARKAHEEGIDFTQTNTHTGQPLPMEYYEAEYIAEKFDCIFGASIRSSEETRRAFLRFFKEAT